MLQYPDWKVKLEDLSALQVATQEKYGEYIFLIQAAETIDL